MLKELIDRVPEKHRFLGFLVITSVIGVTLILIAVYNASRELEVVHEIENLHRFALAQVDAAGELPADQRNLLALGRGNYRVLMVRDGDIIGDSAADLTAAPELQPSLLEETRFNPAGGYLELDGDILTWTRVPLDREHADLILLHAFSAGGVTALKQVYLKRLLVPALFYIWLMVWMAFIVRFLTGELSRKKRELEHMAMHDTLTGLPNRNLLARRLERLLGADNRKHHRFAFAVIDLDGFKSINDTLGHDAGDALLTEIAGRLRTCLRSRDTIARVGGDEFVLLLDDMEQGSSLEVCKRIAREIARAMIFQGQRVCVGSSIGVANFPEHGSDAETLNRRADQAMYAIKAAGGGIRLFGSPEAIAPATETLNTGA